MNMCIDSMDRHVCGHLYRHTTKHSMCINMCTDMCIDMWMYVCTDMCTGMCTDMSIGMCIGMCLDMRMCRFQHVDSMDEAHRIDHWEGTPRHATPRHANTLARSHSLHCTTAVPHCTVLDIVIHVQIVAQTQGRSRQRLDR